MTPTVSVTTASKNYARFLPEMIESVLAQTFTDWELVIVDDGSTDDTPAVVRPFLLDRRVRCVRSDALGIARAKSLAVRLSRGPLVAFLDADDAWEPTKLEQQVALFAGRPEVGVVFCRRTLMDERGAPLPQRPAPLPPRGRVLDHLFGRNFVCFSSAVARREALHRGGAFDPRCDLAVDFDLWLRLAEHCEFDYADAELVRYRTGHGNASKKVLDRVDIALSILRRAEARAAARGCPIAPHRVADSYAATCRTLAYVLRSSEPAAAARWYLRALRWPADRVASLKGLVACALRIASGRREPGAPENASPNC